MQFSVWLEIEGSGRCGGNNSGGDSGDNGGDSGSCSTVDQGDEGNRLSWSRGTQTTTGNMPTRIFVQ